MKFTSMCVHALCALVYLARRRGGGLVPAAKIARAERLSRTFLVKALKALVSAGVLRSSKGPSGGYGLARPARSVTLLEVVEAVDGPIRGDAMRLVGKGSARLDARLQGVCDRVAEVVRHRLRKVSLADLAGKGGTG
jgi:Rrf2 family protein